MSCGVETEANALMTSLMAGVDIDIPVIDLSGMNYQFPNTDIRLPIIALKNSDLTTGMVNGTGTFDQMMKSVGAHLTAEYEATRITGAEYTKAYAALVSAAMSNSTQFLLQRDQTYWQTQLLQIQAISARVTLEVVKLEAAMKALQAKTIEAEYATAKIKLANASNEYCLSKHELETMRPLQAAGLVEDNKAKVFNVLSMLPAQLENLEYQGNVLKEQVEVQRAQTQDTRTDGFAVTGSVGKQKDLYTQQISSYKRDSELKVAKLLSDAWITQKTIDEGLLAPTQFTNAKIDEVFGAVRVANGLI